MKNNIKIGIVQLLIESDIFSTDIRQKNIQHTLKKVEELLENEKNLDMVVIPEEFYAGAGYGPLSVPDPISKIETDLFIPLGKLAEKYQTYIAGALNAKLNPNDFKSNNLGFIIGRNGKVLGYQERFHKSVTEAPYAFTGKEFKVFDLEDIGKVSLLIGNDVVFPEIARKFVLNGAQILISPIISPGESYEKYNYPNVLYKVCAFSRALENQVFVVLANGVGTFAHVDMDIFGESGIYGPLGEIKTLDNKEGFLVAEVDKNEIKVAKRKYPLWEMRDTESCTIK